MNINFKNIRKSFVHIFGGSVLTEDFFVRNMRFFVTVIIIIIIFISHKYTVLSKMSQIEKLEYQLRDAKFEALTYSSSLTEASRQTEVERILEQAGLDLSVSHEPVYVIEK